MADEDRVDLSARARRLAEELLQELQGGGGHAPAPEISGYVDVWAFNLLREGKSPGTVRGYKSSVGDLLRFNPAPNRQDIERWLGEKRANGCSASHINNCLAAAKSFFRSLVDVEVLSLDPTAKIRRSKMPHRERAIPSVEDLVTFLKSPILRLKDVSMVMLMLDSGIRIAELCGIRLTDLDLDHLQAVVIGKGNKQRTVVFGEETAINIRFYLATRPMQSHYLFSTRDGSGPCREEIVQQRMRWLCERVGIPAFSPHQLRHFFASAMLEDGADLKVVSELLGHSSAATTLMIYRHILDANAKRNEHTKHNPLKRLKGE